MAQDTETFNRELYDILKVRGYKPVPLNSQNQRVGASQQADVVEFTFSKDGEDYGKAWISVDDASNLKVYFDDEQQDSPDTKTPGVDYDDTWTGLLKHLKQWAQRRQLSFELANKDRLGDDMRQREYYKMKEKLGESYHPMGKKASYNDAVPNVKIILQHNRALEEGEQRYRNVSRIFLENEHGERFLAPTTRPGIARVYARHIAEGGVPNDERWNHIKSICEDYSKMSGFVRATKNKQFNESAQELINEGVNHYNNLRETLHKLAGHRGYQAYFESWTPALMEGEGEDISEMFMSQSLDPRIESAMPILSRLKKPVTEMEEVDSLAEWADDIINEKMDSTTASLAVPADEMLDEAPGAETLSHNQSTEKSNLAAFDLDEGDVIPFKKKDEDDLDDDSWIPSEEDFEQEEKHKNRKSKAANDVNEMDKSSNDYNGWGHSKHEVRTGPDKTAKMMKAKDAIKAARKALDKAFKGDVEENFIGMSPQAVAEEVGKVHSTYADERHRGTGYLYRVSHDGQITSSGNYRHNKKFKTPEKAAEYLEKQGFTKQFHEEVDEGLDANQKRVGQVGPTEKAKNISPVLGKEPKEHPFNGKLVGAESKEIDPELARIMEIAGIKTN